MGFERNHKNKLIEFERKVLRRIFFFFLKRDGKRGIYTIDKLDELISHKNIINHIKAKRISWFGHLQRMSEERIVKIYISGIRC
jgi:hypothetical protein